jgi:hypothetical protein
VLDLDELMLFLIDIVQSIKFRLLSLLSAWSSQINLPPVITNLPSGACRMSSARDLMFGKSKSPESLPPTSDALKLHIERAHFQASVWKQANVVKPVLPFPITMGWSLDGARY